jgi:hypothetical protein
MLNQINHEYKDKCYMISLTSQAWWHHIYNPIFQKAEDHEFKASVGYTVASSFTKSLKIEKLRESRIEVIIGWGD